MELDDLYASEDILVLVFTDRHGQRWAWQWQAFTVYRAEPDRSARLANDLADDLAHGGFSEPDAEGVRWLISETR